MTIEFAASSLSILYFTIKFLICFISVTLFGHGCLILPLGGAWSEIRIGDRPCQTVSPSVSQPANIPVLLPFSAEKFHVLLCI